MNDLKGEARCIVKRTLLLHVICAVDTNYNHMSWGFDRLNLQRVKDP